MYLIFDTETTGLPKDFNSHYSDFHNWDTARCVQVAWQLHDRYGVLIDSGNKIVKPEGFEIPQPSRPPPGSATLSGGALRHPAGYAGDEGPRRH